MSINRTNRKISLLVALVTLFLWDFKLISNDISVLSIRLSSKPANPPTFTDVFKCKFSRVDRDSSELARFELSSSNQEFEQEFSDEKVKLYVVVDHPDVPKAIYFQLKKTAEQTYSFGRMHLDTKSELFTGGLGDNSTGKLFELSCTR